MAHIVVPIGDPMGFFLRDTPHVDNVFQFAALCWLECNSLENSPECQILKSTVMPVKAGNHNFILSDPQGTQIPFPLQNVEVMQLKCLQPVASSIGKNRMLHLLVTNAMHFTAIMYDEMMSHPSTPLQTIRDAIVFATLHKFKASTVQPYIDLIQKCGAMKIAVDDYKRQPVLDISSLCPSSASMMARKILIVKRDHRSLCNLVDTKPLIHISGTGQSYLSNTAKYIAIINTNFMGFQTIQIRCSETGDVLHRIHNILAVTNFTFTEFDESFYFVKGGDHLVEYNLTTGQTFTHKLPPHGILLTNHQSIIELTKRKSGISLHDYANHKSIEIENSTFGSRHFSPDGNIIALVTPFVRVDFYDTKTGAKLHTRCSDHLNLLSDGETVEISRCGKYIAIASGPNASILEVYSMEMGELINSYDTIEKGKFRFVAEGEAIVIQTSSDCLTCYDIATHSAIHTIHSRCTIEDFHIY